MERGSTGDNAIFAWDESADAFVMGTTTATGASTGDLTIANGELRLDTLRIDQSGTGLRMTNVGAFDNDGSDNFRIFATNDLQLKANGDTGGGLSIDVTNNDVTIDNDLRVSAGQFYYGGTAVTSTAAELNVLDGIPGTLTATELGYVDGVTSAIQTQLDGKVDTTGNNTITSTTAGSAAAPEFELFRDITGADANYIGQIKFSADNDADQKTVFAKITGKIGDASDGSEDGIIEIAHQKAGSNNIGIRITSTEFKIMNGMDFDVETHDGSSNGLRLNNTLVTATAAELNILDGVTATTAELNILDGDTSATATTLVDADRFVVNDNGTMVQVAASDVATYIGAGTNVFKTISVAGQSDVVADSATDTLTLAAGSGMSLTTDASTDTITFTSVSSESVFRADTNLGNVADSHTASEDLGNTADSASDTYDLGTIAVQGVVVSGVVAGLSNASSGFVQADGDGTFSIGTPTATVEDNGVTTAKIADANVTTAKIADANVTTAKIADSNVTTAKIADANVTTAKIADDAVTGVKLSGLTDSSNGFIQADGDGTFSIGTPDSITDGTSTLDFNGSNQVQSDASIVPNANGTLDLGTSSLRWQNIYTSDLNLSNGIGDYTVVEGEEDLFLYNNKSGKVFKFALIEVDPSEATPKIEDLKNGSNR